MIGSSLGMLRISFKISFTWRYRNSKIRFDNKGWRVYECLENSMNVIEIHILAQLASSLSLKHMHCHLAHWHILCLTTHRHSELSKKLLIEKHIQLVFNFDLNLAHFSIYLRSRFEAHPTQFAISINSLDLTICWSWFKKTHIDQNVRNLFFSTTESC